MRDEKKNCKISVGNITVAAPTVGEAKQLYDIACGTKQVKPIDQAIR